MNCLPTISSTSEEIQAQREIPVICFRWENKERFWNIHCKTRKSGLNQKNNKQATARIVANFINGKELIAVVACFISRASFGLVFFFLLFNFCKYLLRRESSVYTLLAIAST